jgi:hypothetical protein
MVQGFKINSLFHPKLTLFFLLFFYSAQANEISCNGSPKFCSRPYNEMTFLMSHNGQSYKRNWLLTFLPGSNIHNQTENLEIQLQDGVRAVKMPVHQSQGVTYVCHGMGKNLRKALQRKGCEKLWFLSQLCNRWMSDIDPCSIDPAAISLVETLGILRSFLEKHPNEIFTFFLEDDASDLNALQVAFEKAGLLPMMHSQDQKAPWPTLLQMIQSGKRLVVFVNREKDLQGKELSNFPKLNSTQYFVWSSPFHFENISQLASDDPQSADVGRLPSKDWNQPPRNKLWLLQHFITPFIAGNEKLAEEANRIDHLKMRTAKYQRVIGSPPNFVSVDFYQLPMNATGAQSFVKQLNQQSDRRLASETK